LYRNTKGRNKSEKRVMLSNPVLTAGMERKKMSRRGGDECSVRTSGASCGAEDGGMRAVWRHVVGSVHSGRNGFMLFEGGNRLGSRGGAR
jgi:hypothetical protein